MSIISLCPACMCGEHDKHVRDWNIKPGLLGGAWCNCQLTSQDCRARFEKFTEKMMSEMGWDQTPAAPVTDAEWCPGPVGVLHPQPKEGT